MPAIEEAPVTTSSLPNKPSFLQSDEFEKSLSEALAKDGKMDAIAPAPAPQPKPGETTPPPKPAEPKPETKPGEADDDVPADIKAPDTRSSWKKLKGALKTVEGERDAVAKERDTFKSELEELKKKATTPAQKRALEEEPEYQALKKSFEEKNQELEAYSERLRLLDVEKHPKFVAYFEDKVNQQMAIAKELGGDKLVEALKLPANEYRKEKLREIAAEMDTVDASTLGSVLTNLRAIEAERASEIAKAKESYQQIQTQEKLRETQQREALTKTFQQVRSDVTDKDKGLAVFREREGDAAWNKGVAERLAVAEAAYNGQLKPEDYARNAFWGAAAPQLLIDLNGALSRNAELEKTIAELRAVTPAPGGTKPGDSPPPPENNKRGLDALMETIQREGGLPAAR